MASTASSPRSAVPLAPWQPWAERVVAFPTLGAAARFGHALAAAEGHRQEGDRRLRRRHPADAEAAGAAGARPATPWRSSWWRRRRRRCSPRWPPITAAPSSTSASARDAEDAAFDGKGRHAAALRIHLEPHHAARAQGRSGDHLSADALSRGARDRDGRGDGAGIRRRNAAPSRIPAPRRARLRVEPADPALPLRGAAWRR